MTSNFSVSLSRENLPCAFSFITGKNISLEMHVCWASQKHVMLLKKKHAMPLEQAYKIYSWTLIETAE